MSQHNRQPDAQEMVTPRFAARWTGLWAPMLLDRLRVVPIAVAVAAVATLGIAPASFADDDDEDRIRHVRRAEASKSGNDEGRLGDVLRVEELYATAVAAGLTTAYMAPLPGGTSKPYLWGGLDPIALINEYKEKIATDPGGVVFISLSTKPGKGQLGRLEHEHLVVLPDGTTGDALFQSDANYLQFLDMTKNGSLIVALGLNCGWGVISGPATDYASKSHFAQPGATAINVERFRDGRVTVLAVNYYLRGDDFKATRERWKYAVEALEALLAGTPDTWGEGTSDNWNLTPKRNLKPVTEIK